MTLVEDWAGFVRAVREMYSQNPDSTRLVVKHNRQRTHVSVKATDNVSCLKFVASNSEQCRKVEGLAALVVQWSFLLPSKGQELSLDPVLEDRFARQDDLQERGRESAVSQDLSSSELRSEGR